MSKEMVKAVKQALREIEDEKQHQKVHGMIALKIAKETPFGKHGIAPTGSHIPLRSTRNLNDSLEEESEADGAKARAIRLLEEME